MFKKIFPVAANSLKLRLGNSSHNSRTFYTYSRKLNKNDQSDLAAKHIPSPLEKKMLVWAKSYQTVEEVPETVSWSQMRRAKDYFRIRINIGMAVMTVFGCIVMIITGKRARDAGDSLNKRGLEWQASMREEGVKEEQSKAS